MREGGGQEPVARKPFAGPFGRRVPRPPGRNKVPPPPPKHDPNPEAIAVAVLARCGPEHPADEVLRQELKATPGLNPAVARQVARWVFAYFRWRGWLDLRHAWSRQLADVEELAERFDENPALFSDADLRRAVPAWALERIPGEVEWLKEIQGEPSLWLRARVGTAAALSRELGFTEAACPVAPEALVYEGTEDLFRSKAFHEGRFEVQDLSSQLVTLVAAPKPGESWWDCCAGEGGKTLHFADRMANKGVVWATDRAEWRLDRLRRRASRAGAFNIRWSRWDGGPESPLPHACDGVLVDAPCTGVGTWQRNPHARWSCTVRDVEELAVRQLDLLKHAATAVKPGGRLVYSVCTLTKDETDGVADAFAAAHPDFMPLEVAPEFRRPAGGSGTAGRVWFWPQHWESNGMFVATWRRAG